MTLLTLDQLKDHVGLVEVSSDALERLMDAAEYAITDRIGPPGDVTERHHGEGRLIGLYRPAGLISQVVENDVTLSSDDYYLRPTGGVLERLSNGTHPAFVWGGHWAGFPGPWPAWGGQRSVVVTYVPIDDFADRVRVQVGLVKLDLEYTPGVASETLGSSTTSSSQQQGVTYAQLREEYLASLSGVPV